MEVISHTFDGIPFLDLAGDFDHASVSSFIQQADKALGQDGNRLLLGLSGCPCTDSGGISCVLSFLSRVRHHGWLGVIAPNPDVLHLLKIVGLTIDPSSLVFPGPNDVQAYLQEPAAI